MTTTPYADDGRPIPHVGNWRKGQRIYTPTPDGFERFLRVSVGLAADACEAPAVNQTSGERIDKRGGTRMDRSGLSVKVQQQGQYELFETPQQHLILVLNNKYWFAWVQGQQGELLVHSDADHQRDHTVQKGQFYLVDFAHDPTYKDMPHLFLQKGDRFEEVMLPNGLPTEEDYQKKLVKTTYTLPKDQLAEYLKHPTPPGPGESRMSRPGGGSMANVVHYLRGIDFPAGRKEVWSHARHEDAPKAVMDQLEQLDDQQFSNMAEVTTAVGKGSKRQTSSGHRSPTAGYDELTVDAVISRLEGLNSEELQAVRSYEEVHKHRKTLLRDLDRRLKSPHDV